MAGYSWILKTLISERRTERASESEREETKADDRGKIIMAEQDMIRGRSREAAGLIKSESIVRPKKGPRRTRQGEA